MKKIDDPLQNDFGTLSQKTGLKVVFDATEKFMTYIRSLLELLRLFEF